MDNVDEMEPWYGVKTVFYNPGHHFEERVIVVEALSFEDAEKKGIEDAMGYIKSLDSLQFVAVVDVFHMFDRTIQSFTEVYSQITETDLSIEEYLRERYEKWDGQVTHKG